MLKKGQPLFSHTKYCINCCMPETEEGFKVNEMGVCRSCQSSEQKMHIDWELRENELFKILETAKSKSGSNYDCILPISGGKDSFFQAHVLVNVYKMKPLAVTFNHNWYSETGWYNLMNLLETFNIDHIMFTPNRGLVNKLAKRSVETIGDTCWHCHNGCGSFPLQVATKFKIPLLIYGESGSESLGRASYYEPIKYDRNYFTTNSAKMTPEQMVNNDITIKDVHPFQLPSEKECEGVVGIHLGDYLFWDGERQTEFVRDEYGWKETDVENSYKHYKSVECMMPGMHDFTCYLKRGFGRATNQVCADVRSGILTREEGFQLINRIDPMRPEALDYFLKVTKMSEEEFYLTMSRQRILKDEDVPIIPKPRPNRERILPFSQQLIEKYNNPRKLSNELKGIKVNIEDLLKDKDYPTQPDIRVASNIWRAGGVISEKGDNFLTTGSIVKKGMYGFKPSFGLIPLTGVVKKASTIDTINILSHKVEHIELLFNAMRVHGHNYPISNIALTNGTRQKKSGAWKIVVIDYPSELVKSIDFSGMGIKKVEIPSDCYHQTYKDIMEPVKGKFQKAINAQEELILKVDEYMKDYDIGITAGKEELLKLCNLPVISFPNGVLVFARKYNDLLLLKFANTYGHVKKLL